ncbi:MAG: response regulator [Rhodanobacteraceae bacterium]|nr:response regulator [Rhodanobacteraceae bacterium]
MPINQAAGAAEWLRIGHAQSCRGRVGPPRSRHGAQARPGPCRIATSAALRDASDTPQATVYIIDDEAQVCAGLARLAFGRAAAADFHRCSPVSGACTDRGRRAHLADVNMPGMSGPELHLHLSEMGLSFPVIYLTGVGNVPLSVQAMKRGAVDFRRSPSMRSCCCR